MPTYRAYLANVDGSSKVYLEADQAPYPHPEPQRSRRVETRMMRPSQSTAGRRVVVDLGSARSYQDLQFSCAYLSDANLQTLYAKWDTYPPVALEYSPDDGTTKYRVAWAENGLEVERWGADPTRYRVRFHLHVLGLQSEF